MREIICTLANPQHLRGTLTHRTRVPCDAHADGFLAIGVSTMLAAGEDEATPPTPSRRDAPQNRGPTQGVVPMSALTRTSIRLWATWVVISVGGQLLGMLIIVAAFWLDGTWG